MFNKSGVKTIAAALVILAAVGYSVEAAANAPIAIGDLLFVKVHRHPDLSSTAQVDESGCITLPYIGKVTVAGLQENEASARVSSAFNVILKSPRVNVTRGAGVSMIGELRSTRSAEMVTQVIPLENSNASVLSSALSDMSSAGGSVSHDPDTNTLILTDTPQALQNMIGVVQDLDRMQSQVTQIHIETKIAEISASAMKELGIRWFAVGDQLSGGSYPASRQNPSLSSAQGSNDPFLNERVGASDNRSGSIGRRYLNEQNFDRRLQLPIQAPIPGQMFLGYMNTGIDLAALIDALIGDNQAELLATPYIRTVNHKTAQIKMTQEFPYTEVGSAGLNTHYSTKFMDVGIVLDVTPHVRRDATGMTYVQMELNPEVSSATGMSNGIPIRSVRSSTSVRPTE